MSRSTDDGQKFQKSGSSVDQFLDAEVEATLWRSCSLVASSSHIGNGAQSVVQQEQVAEEEAERMAFFKSHDVVAAEEDDRASVVDRSDFGVVDRSGLVEEDEVDFC